MKHIWDVEELATHWSLSFEEMQLLKSKPARNHLPLVAQLKHYQYTGRFPGAVGDIPPRILHYLADRVDADVSQTKACDWSGRTGTDTGGRSSNFWVSGAYLLKIRHSFQTD